MFGKWWKFCVKIDVKFIVWKIFLLEFKGLLMYLFKFVFNFRSSNGGNWCKGGV